MNGQRNDNDLLILRKKIVEIKWEKVRSQDKKSIRYDCWSHSITAI